MCWCRCIRNRSLVGAVIARSRRAGRERIAPDVPMGCDLAPLSGLGLGDGDDNDSSSNMVMMVMIPRKGMAAESQPSRPPATCTALHLPINVRCTFPLFRKGRQEGAQGKVPGNRYPLQQGGVASCEGTSACPHYCFLVETHEQSKPVSITLREWIQNVHPVPCPCRNPSIGTRSVFS